MISETDPKRSHYSRDPIGHLPKPDETGRIVLFSTTSAMERLMFDTDGIASGNSNYSLRLRWNEITAINTEAVALPFATPASEWYFQTRVKLVGRETTIILNPVFSVAPGEIIKYVREQCANYGNNLDERVFDATPRPMKFIAELTPGKRLLLFVIIMMSIIIMQALFPHSSFWSS